MLVKEGGPSGFLPQKTNNAEWKAFPHMKSSSLIWRHRCHHTWVIWSTLLQEIFLPDGTSWIIVDSSTRHSNVSFPKEILLLISNTMYLKTGFPRCRDFGKKSGIVICDSRPGNSREFHLFCLEFGKMRASEFFLKLKWWVMYFWQSRDASLAYLQACMSLAYGLALTNQRQH